MDHRRDPCRAHQSSGNLALDLPIEGSRLLSLPLHWVDHRCRLTLLSVLLMGTEPDSGPRGNEGHPEELLHRHGPPATRVPELHRAFRKEQRGFDNLRSPLRDHRLLHSLVV